MRHRTSIAIAVAACVAALSVVYSSQSVIAQNGSSVTAGVYTEAQAKRGDKLYAENCAACHGADLMGSTIIPPLTGAEFAASWQGKTVGDLFEKIVTTMPAIAPGTYTNEQTADTIAYMLSVAKYPAGMTELTPKQDALLQITIEPPAK
jgi:mono/diheme cytochrome c family protein